MNEKSPLLFVIFGATGDLANRKIIPALAQLFSTKLLNREIKIIGFSRKDLSDDDYRQFAKKSIQSAKIDLPEQDLVDFLKLVHYKQGDMNKLDSFDELKIYLSEIGNTFSNGEPEKIFYLALPPNLYEQSFSNLSDSKLVDSFDRILVEKPFGTDINESQRLDRLLGKLFDENQIFRIDHYLAKEAIQNILTFRFANAIFEPLWNGEHIEKIQILLYENGGISNRSNFYNDIGALRDVGQNHILQMIATIVMNDPQGTTAPKIRKSRYEALSKLKLFSGKVEEAAFRGQYDSYVSEIGQNSKTETFFRFKLKVDDQKWHGVPIYVESGKALSENLVEIIVTFKQKKSFVCPIGDVCSYNNVVKFKISPDSKISVLFWTKKSGFNFDVEQKEMTFSFEKNNLTLNSDYQKVLYDCISGDLTLFPSTEEVATQWRVINEILSKWHVLPLEIYKKGIIPSEITKTFN
ncbi:MAG TPA: glucose-6-phosphate dehydrogenase [Candidatus Paceibacterota bacterium]|nr:glucose-6-phosphate dehydrogenase [Candidatus Paceibacterota bacterium]